MILRRPLPLLLTTAALLTALTSCAAPAPEPTAQSSSTPTATPAGPALPPPLSASELAGLPAATYDAVIAGLIAAPSSSRISTVARVAFDTPLYGADHTTPVARIPARNFLGEPTVVVPVETKGDWSLVLTPARRQLPSTSSADSPAPAQTAAWVPTRILLPTGEVNSSVVISTGKQTLSIVDEHGTALHTFPVGVGTADTPTPTGTGYLQARYLDPAQGQEEHRIQLTSLHATAADEPYGGTDGGLIGIHFQSTARGAVSHGCVRLSADAIAAVDALPLGTAVRITD